MLTELRYLVTAVWRRAAGLRFRSSTLFRWRLIESGKRLRHGLDSARICFVGLTLAVVFLLLVGSAIAVILLLGLFPSESIPDAFWKDVLETARTWTDELAMTGIALVGTIAMALAVSVLLSRRRRRGSTLLHWSAMWDSELVTKAVMAVGVKGLEVGDRSGGTPLHWPVAAASEAVVNVLLGAGAQVSAPDEAGGTPLHWAASIGHKLGNRDPDALDRLSAQTHAVLESLLKGGAQIDACDQAGLTPLHWAASEDSDVVVDALLRAGADMEARDRCGRTPLHGAAKEGSHLNVRALLAAGADVNATASPFGVARGRAPLHWAVEKDALEAVVGLLRARADVEVHDGYGRTPLRLARSAAVATALLHAGACIHDRDENAGTPLHAAADWGRPMVVNALVDAGADVEARDKYGCSPLHLAAAAGEPAAVRALLHAGADVEARDQDGRTPLHDAANHSFGAHSQVVEILLAAGAPVDLRDEHGCTPSDLTRGRRAEWESDPASKAYRTYTSMLRRLSAPKSS